MSGKLQIAYHPCYGHPLPVDHRFPMLKYELIPGQLLYEGTIDQSNLFQPGPCDDDTVLLTHTPEYIAKLQGQGLSASEQRRIGFPQSDQLTQREWIITQGTIDCCNHALVNGVSLNVAGGTHHAFKDRGEGFCLLNDFAVAANYLLNKKKATKILIIDLDVHQGNGTARIFQDETSVFTFSMHGAHNYPFHKERSDLDVGLEDGTTGEVYLHLLNQALSRLLAEVKPDFAFYLSGVDILQTDKFGKLKVTVDECMQRDTTVFTALREAGIPCAVSMGGGYSPDIKTIVEAHCNTFRQAKEIYDLH